MSASYQTPIVDTVVLPAQQPVAGGKVTVRVSCELMKNQQAASPIEAGKNILVAQDDRGQPLIFTIGADEHLRLLACDPGSASGWRVFDLSAELNGYVATKAFDITQDMEGRISVALAASKAGAIATDIFIAPLLATQGGGPDWSNLAGACRRIAAIDPDFTAEKIQMGSSEDSTAPLLVVSGNINGRKYFYEVTGADLVARKLEFPENIDPAGDSLTALSIGHAFGQRGIFFLYKIGDTQTLECTTLADQRQGSLHYDYSPGNPRIAPTLGAERYNCMAVSPGSDRTVLSSDLYVGTDRAVYLFKGASTRGLQKVTDRLKDIREIVVREDRDNISLWLLCSPDQLYYIRGEKGPVYKWSAPILFKDGVVHIAPIRNRLRQANELFLVDQDLNLVHFWQDPTHTLWQQRLMKTPNTNFLIDFNSYTTQVHLEDNNGDSLAGRKLSVTADEWMYVTINGRTYILDRDNPSGIDTDLMGNVTIVAMTAGVATPVLHVQSPLFAKTLNIYANGKVEKGLRDVRSGADLEQARTQDDKPLLDASVSRSTADGVAAHIGQLTQVGGNYIEGKRVDGSVFVAVDDHKHTSLLDVAALPSDFAIGMRLVNGVWQPHTAASLGALRVGDIFDDLGELAGDALHWLETAFVDGIRLVEQEVTYLKDGVSFVIKKIEDGLLFVLTLPDRIVNIALKSLGAIFRVLGWVLKLVGIALKDLLAWLGHLFGWDDIWETHKVIASMMTNGLDSLLRYARSELEGWRTALRGEFQKIERHLDALAAVDGLRGQSFRDPAKRKDAAPASSALLSPPASWSFYQIQHGGLLASGGGLMAVGAAATDGDPLRQFVTETAIPTITQLASDVAADIADLERLLTGGIASVAEIVKFVADLAKTAVEPVAALLDGFIQLAEGLLSALRRALEDDLDIPFLSDFYEFVTDLLGDEERLTGINAVALLLAIPLTIASKAVTGEAPFHSGRFGLDDSGLFDRLIAGSQHRRESDARPQMVPPAALGQLDYAEFARKYAHIGGAIGSLAGLAGTGINWGISTGWSWGLFPIMQFGFGLSKYVSTVPLQLPAENTAAEVSYGFRWAGYAVGVLNVVAQGAVAATAALRDLPAPTVSIWKGGFTIGCDTIILAAACVSDIINSVENDQITTVLSVVPDVISNGGGIVMGVGQVSPDDTPLKAALPVGATIALIGAGIGAAFAIAASANDQKDLFQLLNPGG